MRHEFSRKVRREAWTRCRGRCERCGVILQRGRYVYDHVIADALGGRNDLGNCQVLGWCCDKPKTVRDVRLIAKVKRIEDKAIGAKTSRSPMPFGKRSRFKKKLDGSIVDRLTGRRVKLPF